MSSPDFLAICCTNRSNMSSKNISDSEKVLVGQIMLIVTMVMSVVSILGVCYLILPRGHSGSALFRNSNRILAGPNLNSVIRCVVATNFLATLGLLVRSVVWLAKEYPQPESLDGRNIFCIITTVWIQYFFLCNFFWQLLYAIEAFLVSMNKELNLALKYFLGWFLPGVFCIGGATSSYFNGLESCFKASGIRYRNYIIFLSPVLIVIIFNPFFFRKAAQAAKKALIWHYGQYTSTERKLVDAIHLKFILIMVTFTACWLPNLINAIIMIADRPTLSVSTSATAVSATLVFMGLLNPLQALFSSLVFWGVPQEAICWNRVFHLSEYSYLDASNINASQSHQTSSTSRSGSETEPLISFRRKEEI